MKVPLTEEVATPLVALLKSHDPEIQKASTLAVSNFAISGPGKRLCKFGEVLISVQILLVLALVFQFLV